MRTWTLFCLLLASVATALAVNGVIISVTMSAGTGSTGCIRICHRPAAIYKPLVQCYVNDGYAGSFSSTASLVVRPALGTHKVHFVSGGARFPAAATQVTLSSSRREASFVVQVTP